MRSLSFPVHARHSQRRWWQHDDVGVILRHQWFWLDSPTSWASSTQGIALATSWRQKSSSAKTKCYWRGFFNRIMLLFTRSSWFRDGFGGKKWSVLDNLLQSSIENLWCAAKKEIKEKMPRNEGKLEIVVKNAWSHIFKPYCEELARSMKRRCAAVIKMMGYSTKYWTNLLCVTTCVFSAVKLLVSSGLTTLCVKYPKTGGVRKLINSSVRIFNFWTFPACVVFEHVCDVRFLAVWLVDRLCFAGLLTFISSLVSTAFCFFQYISCICNAMKPNVTAGT